MSASCELGADQRLWARGNLFLPFVKILVGVPMICVFIWIVPELHKQPMAGMPAVLIFCLVGLVLAGRGVHALIKRAYVRADSEFLELRHWRTDLRILLPFCWWGTDRIAWSDIRSVKHKYLRAGLLAMDHRIVIELGIGRSVELVWGVFDRSIDEIAELILNRVAAIELSRALPVGHAKAYVARLRHHFASTVSLSCSPREYRLAGLFIGLPLAIASGWWLWRFVGERAGPEVPIAFFFAAAGFWFFIGIDESIWWIRHRRKHFWFRSDGMAFGRSEFTARYVPWHDVIGARRRVPLRQDPWGRIASGKPRGLDVICRDGSSVCIPEEFSNSLDELCEVLTPKVEEVVFAAELAE